MHSTLQGKAQVILGCIPVRRRLANHQPALERTNEPKPVAVQQQWIGRKLANQAMHGALPSSNCSTTQLSKDDQARHTSRGTLRACELASDASPHHARMLRPDTAGAYTPGTQPKVQQQTHKQATSTCGSRCMHSASHAERCRCAGGRLPVRHAMGWRHRPYRNNKVTCVWHGVVTGQWPQQ